MVRDTTQIARARIGSQGLRTRVSGIPRCQEGNGQDVHRADVDRRRSKEHIDELPRPVVLDGAFSLPIEGPGQIAQRRFQLPIDGIRGGVVHIAHRQDARDADALQGIGQLLQT